MSKRCVTRLFAAALIAIVSIGCSGEKTGKPTTAAQTPPPPREAPAPDTSPEHLLAQPPEGWKQNFRTEGPGIRMVEYVPPDSDADEWTDKLSFESFSDPPLPDPIELLKSIANDQRSTCDKFSDHDTFSGLENDYPTSVRLFICYQNKLTKKGQLTLVKTIKGDTHFFVITRAKRVPPIDGSADKPDPEVAKAVAEWSAYLRAISVCNDTSDRHPCPAGAQPTQSDSPVKDTPVKSE